MAIPNHWPGTVRNAASASLADVQAAVNAAVNGDIVQIPNGSAAWSGGISTSKQILIRAQNITETPAGTMTRNVTITNNASAPLLSLVDGSTYHVGVAGIRFNEGSGDAPFVHFSGSGSKVPLLFDCAFSTRTINGSAESVARVVWLAQGGVCWNSRFDGSAFPYSVDDVGNNVGASFCHFKSPRAWTTASTMGAADANGLINVYFENCTFYLCATGDIDDHGRVVVRYSMINGCWWETHGFTSSFGGRHWELYNNTIQSSASPRNLAGRYFWCRAGSGIFTDNVVNDAADTSAYGSVALLHIGDNTSPGSYPMNRQPGGGHNGSSYVIDPIYIWNNTGARAYTWGFTDSPGGWEGIVVQNRDIFINNGAKPGYSKFTYPHPLRSTAAGSVPGAPTGFRIGA